MSASVLPDICTCDVENKEQLALYRRCRERWSAWLFGEDEHSISQQITSVSWDDAIFRTLNEARRIAVQSQRGFNADLLCLLDRGFVTTQIMALRRLTDSGVRDPKKEVISLVRLLRDIGANRELLTRENYICFDGTPFQAPGTETDDLRSFMSDRMHHTFDLLSGTSPGTRSRHDRVKESIIRNVVKSLEICDDFRDYANKFLAHAAAPSAARERVREEFRITLDKFDLAYRAVVQAASFVGLGILYERSLEAVPPTPQYDHLEHLDQPLVLPADYDALQDFWRARVREVETWSENLLTTWESEDEA